MRYQGLVFLVVLALADSATAQSGSLAPEQNFLPPSPRKLDGGNIGEPTPLLPSPVTAEPLASTNIEIEIKQFRSELRDFQTIREEVARGTRSTDAAAENLSTHQRQELMDLLAKLAKKSLARKTAAAQAQLSASEPILRSSDPAETPPVQIDSSDPTISIDVADAFALGKVLFKQGDFAGAEKAFRKTIVTSENEMTLKYLLATCLRRQSRWQPAIDGYKSVAESNQDPVLRDLAKWQLENIRWHQQSEAQLEQMRKQREKRLEAPSNQPANSINSK
jgi:tetratricopeptide (TPR) repeat protein